MMALTEEVIDEAAAAFRAALAHHLPHGHGGYWVPGSVEAIVTALLLDHWRAPRHPAAPAPPPAPARPGSAPGAEPGDLSSRTGDHRHG